MKRTRGRYENAIYNVQKGNPNSQELCDLYNLQAAEYLQRHQYQEAKILLFKAQSLSNNPKILAKTYQKLAIYYRNHNKTRISLNYLHKACQFDPSPELHLNYCAVLSTLQKHAQALQQAMHAVIMIQDQMLEASLQRNTFLLQEKSPVLAIGYHNVAVELQHLRRFVQAQQYYAKAVSYGEKHLDKHKILRRSLKEAQEKALIQQSKRKISNKKVQGKRLVLKGLPQKSVSPITARTVSRKTPDLPLTQRIQRKHSHRKLVKANQPVAQPLQNYEKFIEEFGNSEIEWSFLQPRLEPGLDEVVEILVTQTIKDCVEELSVMYNE